MFVLLCSRAEIAELNKPHFLSLSWFVGCSGFTNTGSFHSPWLHMTFVLHKPKNKDSKLNEGEFLILCETKQLVFGFTNTTTPNTLQTLQGFCLQK